MDSLLQTFENCRPGLPDDRLELGDAEAFFAHLYEQEKSRLSEAVRVEQ